MSLLDRPRLAFAYYKRMGRWPNLSFPQRFSEKIQCAKLQWRTPSMPLLADKIAVKPIVAKRLGPDWVTPNLFVGDQLPPPAQCSWPRPYVIKANNSSGTNFFVAGESETDWETISARLERRLARPYGRRLGEWAYSQIAPKVLVEPLIGDPRTLRDYKFFLFDGRAEFVQIHTNRQTDHRNCFYTRNWEKLPYALHFPFEEAEIERPKCLDEMIWGAERMADGFPFLRVDFYVVNGHPRFGEVTFYPGSGFRKFSDPAADDYFGSLWPDRLPTDQMAG